MIASTPLVPHPVLIPLQLPASFSWLRVSHRRSPSSLFPLRRTSSSLSRPGEVAVSLIVLQYALDFVPAEQPLCFATAWAWCSGSVASLLVWGFGVFLPTIYLGRWQDTYSPYRELKQLFEHGDIYIYICRSRPESRSP